MRRIFGRSGRVLNAVGRVFKNAFQSGVHESMSFSSMRKENGMSMRQKSHTHTSYFDFFIILKSKSHTHTFTNIEVNLNMSYFLHDNKVKSEVTS